MSQVSPVFNNLPIDVIYRIIEKAEPIDRLVLQKVSRSLKTAVVHIGLGFTEIFAGLYSENSILLTLDGKRVSYENCNGDCLVKYLEYRERRIDGENHLKIAFNDLAGCLEGGIATFKILMGTMEGEDREEHVQTLRATMKRGITAKRVDLGIFGSTEIITLLSIFKPGFLEEIRLDNVTNMDKFEDLCRLSQWREAQTVYFRGNGEDAPIEEFFNFREFYISVGRLLMEDVVKVRDILLERDTFLQCEINAGFLATQTEIAKVFEYSGGGNSFEYTTNTAKFNIRVDSSHLWIRRVFEQNH
ncbi:F-box domain-containing protein [Caenorhabditis elegans]|uniref:F-box domain-containing protein n=1 Tax=Caenorhabditis elegans TaxID=6239 RepID=Q95XB9_CAEEL|nr:F-box domain-containing protein [Caenorhabditis elegans]CCD73899.1 F-box domain-containing protein [Caenorhabditis elegans]|eukprot:NP_497381.2 F-box A protein [Caenorhabditis elegans]